MKLLFICLLSYLVIVEGQYYGMPNFGGLNSGLNDGYRAIRIQIPRSSLGSMSPFFNPNNIMSPEANDDDQSEDAPQNPNLKKQNDANPQEQPQVFSLPISGMNRMPGNIRIRIIDPSQLQNIPNLMNPEQNPLNQQRKPKNPKAKKNNQPPKPENQPRDPKDQPQNPAGPSNPVPIVLPDGRVAVVDSQLLNQLLSKPSGQPEMQPKSSDVSPKKPNKQTANPKEEEPSSSPTENPEDQIDNTTPASLESKDDKDDKDVTQPRKANKPISQVSSKSPQNPQNSPKKSKPLVCTDSEDKQ